MKASSKEIHRASRKDAHDVIYDVKQKEDDDKLGKIPSGLSCFLNFNAIVLICVFILCYALFS